MDFRKVNVETSWNASENIEFEIVCVVTYRPGVGGNFTVKGLEDYFNECMPEYMELEITHITEKRYTTSTLYVYEKE